MSVKISLEFANVEEAIAALGKLAGIAPVAAPAAQPAAQPKKERQPRADKGQPRGPNARTAGEPNARTAGEPNANGTGAALSIPTQGLAPAAGSAPATQAPVPAAPVPAAPAQTVQPTAPAQSTAPAAAVPTPEQVQAAVEKVFAKLDYDGTAQILARYGVKRGKDILPEMRADFIAKVNRVVDQGEAI